MDQKIKPGTNGDHYIPYAERSGNESIVYFTRDLSAEGLKKIYERVCAPIKGKVAIKLHTGEPHGPTSSRGIGSKTWSKQTCRMPISSKPTPSTKVTATRPKNTVRHWKSTAGPSAPLTSPMMKAPHSFPSREESGSKTCPSVKPCLIMTLWSR